MKLKVVSIQGKETSKEVTLPAGIFGIEPNDHAIYLAVKSYLANQRQGTHKSKEKSEVAGSTRKIKRQKGTGTARAGSIKSPVFVGGGRIFGPRPRSYEQKLNKKVSALARKSALSYKAKDKNVMVVEDFNMEKPKTKDFSKILSNLGAADKKALFLVAEKDNNLYLSGRNLPNANVAEARTLNVYDVLNAQVLILSESSVKEIENTLG